ncbi:MAG TPA: enoyl-CoA hydratase/isomerase family protein [Burkholderiales bacterium]|jgi:thioesterase DpgC|nr:enoyl-CoA hydratase/isomerase family protein [Burkholderiales bacterium]
MSDWRAEIPTNTGDFEQDCERYARFWRRTAEALARLPVRPARRAQEAEAAEELKRAAREARKRFALAHARTIYDRLTDGRSRFVRVQRLVYDAAALVPGLVPAREEVEKESALPLRDKEGHEIDQGILVWAILADPVAGRHLCHAMLLPRPEALERLSELRKTGRIDLGPAQVRREGKASVVTLKNPRYLNAEDNTTIDHTEIAVDLAILDPATEIAVLRGDVVQTGKYQDRRVLGSGINLTHLYRGRIPYIWYLQRELGFVHKFFRGLARPEVAPDDVTGETIDKPWMAVVEGFAIGGHCQYLLTMDYVLAADDAYMTLPARKEGIIPGAANLRLARFTGDRIAREAILYQRRIDCASPQGRLVCDEVVPQSEIDAAIARVVDNFTHSGMVSAAANRRAFRVAQEPLDLFRNYCAVYALEQAYCHFSPALIDNLERYWDAQNRKP